MKSSFITRMYGPLVVCWACMVFATAPRLEAVATAVVAAILVVSALAVGVVSCRILSGPSQVPTSELLRFSKASYLNYAAIGVVFMASGYTYLGWGWIVVALARAAISMWAEDRVKTMG